MIPKHSLTCFSKFALFNLKLSYRLQPRLFLEITGELCTKYIFIFRNSKSYPFLFQFKFSGSGKIIYIYFSL